MKKIAISIGDINGIGPQIALEEHKNISQYCQPVYCVHSEILENACEILGTCMPADMELFPPSTPIIPVCPARIESNSGMYSYKSFIKAIELVENGFAQSLCTLPIHKKAWQLSNVSEIGHTEVLAKRYNKNAIMMLGCKDLFVALFTDHIPLKAVSEKILPEKLTKFLFDLYCCTKMKNALVLGVNPHCGDKGVMGNEDENIEIAIRQANKMLGQEIFIGPIPPDTAFSPPNRIKYHFFVSMYHDVGLAVLKALYFYESINVTLNIPIFRTSVDHGVAYNLAYQSNPNTLSYLNAIALAIKKDFK